MTIGKEIKRLRLEKGLTQEKFAKKIGVLKQSVSLWESEKTKPNNTNVNKISEVFHVNFSEFLDADAIVTHWVSVKERLPVESKPYVCFGVRADGNGGAMKWADVLDYHGPEQGEEIHQSFTWGRAEGMVVTHWLEGLEMPDLEGVL